MTYAQNEALRRQRTIDAQNQQIIMEEQRRRDGEIRGRETPAPGYSAASSVSHLSSLF